MEIVMGLIIIVLAGVCCHLYKENKRLKKNYKNATADATYFHDQLP